MKVYRFRPIKEIVWLIHIPIVILLYLVLGIWKAGVLYIQNFTKLLVGAIILMIVILPIFIFYLMHWKFAQLLINEKGLEIIDWKKKYHFIPWQRIKSVCSSGYGAISGIWLYLNNNKKSLFFLNLTGLDRSKIQEILFYIKNKIKNQPND